MNDWLQHPVAVPDARATAEALARQGQLTKPPGALGRLEALAVRLAGMQGSVRPSLARVRIVVFAADHGVTAEGVSAFPSEVTAQMVHNFAAGGAAISVLARELGAELEVVDVGVARPLPPLPGVVAARVADGSANLAREPAMSGAQLGAALAVGRDAARRAIAAGAQLFIGGEMGIGNTSAAAALACACLGLPAAALAGPGTGLDSAGVARKATVIQRGLDLHGAALADPLEALRRVGGFEIAALAGAFTACAQAARPVLVDGFIASAAALAAVRINPGVGDWLLFGHLSREPGHRAVLDALAAEPLLDLGMRLGEGSGAAVALPLLRLACALHDGMATFAEAGVSEG
jgi:nicotinate-nucleotide--dimethylbenzimidazole phosphoribosyltransferase